jgi:hypothetical protein
MPIAFHYLSRVLMSCAVAGLLLFLLALTGVPLHAQAPAWQRAVAIDVAGGRNPVSYVQAIATDSSGNVFLAGAFSGTARFSDVTLTTADNQTNLYVAKWSSNSGRFVWAQQADNLDASSELIAQAVAVRGSDVFVVGSLVGTARLGSTTLVGNHNSSMFVAKLVDAGPTGNFVWAQKPTSPEYSAAQAVAVHNASVYVSGLFFGTARFGATALTVGPQQAAAFLVKLTDAGTTGTFTWAQSVSGPGASIQVPALGVNGPSVYLAGYFQGPTATFGSLRLANTGGYDGFLAKLTDAGATGTFAWAQQIGGPDFEQATALAVRGSNVYVSGWFNSASARFGAVNLANSGGMYTSDVFVAKLTDAGPEGQFVWAQGAGGPANDMARDLAVTSSGVYVSGEFLGSARFGSATYYPTANYPVASSSSVFLAKLTDAGPSGSFAWAQHADGLGSNYGQAVAASSTAVYLAGALAATSRFSSTTLTSTTSNSYGFLASVQDDVKLAATPPGPLAAVTLFPNPARAHTTIVVPAKAGVATATLTLADALGRPVKTSTSSLPAAGLRHELDLAGLPSGVYTLRVQVDSAIFMRRLVVE